MIPDHIIASNKYGRYCVPKSSQSRPAARAVLAGKVWEEKTISLMAMNCGNGDIVHAGTYFGDFLPGLSRALKPGALLWAFEPSNENFLCAQQTVALNNLKNISLIHAGLGARRGKGSLCISAAGEAQGGSSSLVQSKIPDAVYEEVRILALDDVVPPDRHVSVVQFDVEDYEQQALKGARDILKRCLPLIILEMLPKSPRWHERNILALGYREIGFVHRNRVLITSVSEPLGFDTLRDSSGERTEQRARRHAARNAIPD
jgi:FkbM family methyltransferase